MSDVTKKDLRELAEKATPGPWWIDSHGHRMSTEDGMTTVFITDDRMGKATRHPETGNLSHWTNDWDASFIVSANPKTVLGLLDEIAALEAELAKLRAGQEPVAYITGQFAGRCVIEAINRAAVLPTGMALYTTPQPSAMPDGLRAKLAEGLDEITSLSRHLRHGGCDSTDLPGLEEGLTHAIDMAAEMLSVLTAAAPSAPATVQGDGWIPVSERLPDVEQRLDKPCELEGKPLPPLNITSTVQCFDGTRVFADALEWFDGGQPMKGVTHWKPLDAAPAAIATARKEGRE